MSQAYFTETFPWLAPMGQFFATLFLVLLMAVSVVALEGRQWSKQKLALKDWRFDETYVQEVLLKYPHLTQMQVLEAFEQLRLYVQICWHYEKRMVAMPSKLIDACWHVFICDTRNYARFCEAILGWFLHHEPSANGELQKADITKLSQLQMLSMARTYQGALAIELKDSTTNQSKVAVPKLFKIDELMGIPGGNNYSVEFLECLAGFDLKKAEAKLSKDEGAADGSGAAGCGDGGACGCGGSV